jgi:predicted  nucleic acid-binding Zn-ribbon protein
MADETHTGGVASMEGQDLPNEQRLRALENRRDELERSLMDRASEESAAEKMEELQREIEFLEAELASPTS